MLSPRVFWQDSWTGRGSGMSQTLVDLGQADGTKAFWALYEANPIMNLPLKCSLHVFRQNVKPEWEDPSNIVGGHFRLSPAIRGAETSILISAAQRLWFNLLTTHVGETFSVPAAVVGCGFTNKGTRQIASLWVNTTDEATITALQADVQKISGDKFTVKFVQHRAIVTESGKTQVTLCHQHRRTRSAPGKILTVDESDEEEVSPAKAAAGSSLQDRRKGAQLALDSKSVGLSTSPPPEGINPHQRSKSDGQRKDVVPVTNLVTHAAPAGVNGKSIVQPSKQAQLLTPHFGPEGSSSLSRPQFTSSSELTWGTTGESSEFRSSGSGLVLPAVAPSPMKEWASGWSPSLLEAAFRAEAQAEALQKKEDGGDEGGVPAEAKAPPLPPVAVAPSPTVAANGVQSPPHSQQEILQQQQAYQQALMLQQQMQMQMQMQGGGAQVLQLPGQMQMQMQMQPQQMAHQQVPPQHLQPQQFQPHPAIPAMHRASGGPDYPQVTHDRAQYAYNNPYAYGSMSAPPQFDVAQAPQHAPPQAPQHAPPQAPQQHHKPTAADSAPEAGPAKSDATSFVFKGYLFPAGLNRKERRRICFSAEFDPMQCAEAVFVGTEQVDGPRDELEEASLRKGLIPKTTPGHARTDSQGKEKWAGAHQ